MRRGLLLGLGLLLTASFMLQAQRTTPEANWVWHDEGNPLSSAPAGARYFRRVFTVEQLPEKVELGLTADNRFVAWLNGVSVGEGSEWNQLHRFDVTKHLRAGKNVLAIEARNDGGPAGLVVQLGSLLVSDREWKSSTTALDGWQGTEFDEKGWKPVKVLGAFGKVGPWSGVASSPGKPGQRRINVPEGFRVEPAVKKPDDLGPFSIVNMTFDAKGRLLLSQEGGPTLLCVDADEKGVYRKVVPYCTQVKNSQGMCWVGDALLLVGNGPQGTGLYRCRDTDDNDEIDQVTLLHKFRGGMGEHGPHAIVHGPDNWLYLVVGNHAGCQPEKLADNSPLTRWPKGTHGPDQGKPDTTEDVLLPRLNDARGHAANILAPGGTIWRLDHEGNNLSLISAGFRNQFDAAFDPNGELFTYDSDMEWDEGLPWYRPVRVVHCVPGGEYGWRTGASKIPPYALDTLPALHDVGRGSPVGVEVYDHSAFPAKYRGAVFACDWSVGVIYAVFPQRHGAGYRATAEKFCTGSPLNVTDCAVAPDGSLYFSLGGRGSQGDVYRIVAEGERKPAESPEVDQPLSAWSRARLAGAVTRTGRKEAVETLVKQADSGNARAVFLLHQIGEPPALETLVRLAGHENAEVRAAALWSIGVQGFKDGERTLVKALADEAPLVRRRACEALVRAGIEPPVEALAPVLVEDDRFAYTAARLVLQRIDPAKWAERLLKSEHKRLLYAAVIALCKTGKADEHGEAILDGLHDVSPGEKQQETLDHLRCVQLALIHTGKRPGSVRGLALEIEGMFLHKDDLVNRELAILLTQFTREKVLDESAHGKLLDALLKTDDHAQQIHYFYCMRLLHEGWTKEQKVNLLAWYDSTRGWTGGSSFHPFLENILKDLGPAFTKEDRVALLAKADALPQSALVLMRSVPADQLPAAADIAAALAKLSATGNVPRGAELRLTLVDSLGRLGTPDAREALQKLADDPNLRDPVALALAKSLNAETYPLVLRGLESSNKQTIFEIVQALKKSPIKPKAEDAKPFRALLLASGRLDPGNRGHAVDLLRHWAGNKRFSADDRDWQAELTAWSRWFGQTFPKEPALPDVVSDKPPESKWKFDELRAYLEGEGKTGDATKGRMAFEKGQCLKCHKYGSEGEGLGPDLTTLSKRFKRSDTLEAMFYPSKVISDQYRSVTLVTGKGQQVIGLAAPQGDTITVLQNDGNKVTLKESEVEQRLASLVSVMPERLLDMLTKEEIRDLFAFLESEPMK